MEIFAFPKHTAETEQAAREFLKKVLVVPLLDMIEWTATSIRRESSPRPKLPDSIVAATAIVFDAQLITTDDKLLRLVWPGFNAASLRSS
jgi:predicted nucleic acid-binding protein